MLGNYNILHYRTSDIGHRKIQHLHIIETNERVTGKPGCEGRWGWGGKLQRMQSDWFISIMCKGYKFYDVY